MPANMKKSGMSYKKGGSKKMYGGTMKKKMYGGSKKKMMKGGSNSKMPKSVYKKGGSKPDFLDFDKDGNTTEPMTSTYMYGGSMYKKMMKYAGGPVMNERGMKVPGMMKAGGGLKKMPGGGFMRSMDLPKAQSGFFKGLGLGKLFGKGKKASNKIIDDFDVSETIFKGVDKKGNKVFKVGVDGKVQDQSTGAIPLFQTFKRMLKQGEFKPKKK